MPAYSMMARLDTWLAGFDTGATVHYTGQYEDDNINLTGSSKPQMPRSGPLPWRARKVSEWVTLDLIASYTFNLPPPASAAGAWLSQGWRQECENERWQGEKRNACLHRGVQSLWMARLAEQHDTYHWDAERVRF